MENKTVTLSLKSIIKIFIVALIIGAAIATIVSFFSKNDDINSIANAVAEKLKGAKETLQDKYHQYAGKYKKCFNR